jgi:hypothetical protein
MVCRHGRRGLERKTAKHLSACAKYRAGCDFPASSDAILSCKVIDTAV